MATRSLIRLSAGTLLLALGSPAFAEYTVTITNATSAAIDVVHKDHYCIHDPSYFDKTVPANGKVEVHANWFTVADGPGCMTSGAGAGTVPIIQVCRTDTNKCGTVNYTNNDKRVLLTTEGSVAIGGD